MASYKVEAVTSKLILGEGPHWDHDEKVLYFVDLPGGTVHKYDPATKKHTYTPRLGEGNLTFILPLKGCKDKFVITIERDVFVMTWNGESGVPSKLERILTVENDDPKKAGNRWNDGKVDRSGRIWAGEGNLTFILPLKGCKDKFVITIERDVFVMTWNGESGVPSKLERILTVENDDPKKAGNRWNDGKVDRSGRIWAGTMGPELTLGVFPPKAGAFYSISKKGIITKHVDKVGISNGLAWSKDSKYLYFVDSHITEVFRYDFDEATGKISNRTSIFDFEKNGVEGFPDGMTIDTEDKLWGACFGPGLVIKVDPETGELLDKVEIPAPNVTSVNFGGPNLDELYVTTARIRITPEQEKQFPDAGALFRVTGVGAKGFPGVPAELCCHSSP